MDLHLWHVVMIGAPLGYGLMVAWLWWMDRRRARSRRSRLLQRCAVLCIVLWSPTAGRVSHISVGGANGNSQEDRCEYASRKGAAPACEASQGLQIGRGCIAGQRDAVYPRVGVHKQSWAKPAAHGLASMMREVVRDGR